MNSEQHDLPAYLFRRQRMAFQVGYRLNVYILPFEDDPAQRWLLGSEGAEVELDGRVRVQHCFVTRYGDVDPRVREETGLRGEGVSSFERVFQRYWAQEYPDRPLSDDTRLFVLMTA
ncbi:hypothetical protein [Polyangium spumosum]|uniref:ASCH domain-containing protein n=1 Tax=Polyangium spumosum TaxID=889282 RepID=A0A6N7PTK8_9BACT|nr:hypothetical protein [Polyangium spumosum]MRG93414.1 hypothetical protein [Polyangium spumosum]